MDYQKWILEQLLDKYYKSKAYTGQQINRRISINVMNETALFSKMESPEEKGLFLSAVKKMKGKGLIDYSWVKYEENNLIEKIWLNTDEEAIAASYNTLGIRSEKKVAENLVCLIEKFLKKAYLGAAMKSFLSGQRDKIRETGKLTRFFTGDLKEDGRLLDCLAFLEENRDEVLERVLSTRLFGDSKYFERVMKRKVLSVLRQIKRREEEDVVADEELLQEKGVVRYPEVMEFTGSIEVTLKNGKTIDFSGLTMGGYINSEAVRQIKNIAAHRVERVLFIENKSNYIWYISRERKENELVLYHGGCYSPVKGMWFKKLREALGACTYYHWSDIDLGGFRIFLRLQDNIIPELKPYNMDAETLEKHAPKGIQMTSAYAENLSKLKQDLRYRQFFDVIDRMICLNLRLEQENLI